MSIQLIYWVSTLLVAAMLTASALSYFFHQSTIVGVRDLGFPDFFRIELAVLKLVAVLVLVVPAFSLQFKEWAYAGIAAFYVTAIVAHFAHKDPIVINLINFFFLGLLVVSNIYLNKMAVG